MPSNGTLSSGMDWKACMMVYYVPYGVIIVVLLVATISGLPNMVGNVLRELCWSMD